MIHVEKGLLKSVQNEELEKRLAAYSTCCFLRGAGLVPRMSMEDWFLG